MQRVGLEATRGSVGSSARRRRGILRLVRPFETREWDDIEKIWNHAFDGKLREASENYPVLLTEHAAITKPYDRERTTRVMFENFNVPALYLTDCAALSMYAANQLTGLALESGHSGTYLVPIYEGYKMPHGIQHVQLAGRQISEALGQLMADIYFSFYTPAELDLLEEMKNRVCYVRESFDYTPIEHMDYELPDGQTIPLGKQRYKAPEVLFNPTKAGFTDDLGIHKLANRAIQLCDRDLHRDLYKNIVLAGGTTMLPGLAKRLEREITNVAPANHEVKVVARGDRNHAAWIGGSILSSLSTFQQCWITKSDYDEYGPSIVHKKCFQ